MNITCTSMESAKLRQFIIVIKIIITISVVHFPNELNQKRSQYLNWYCNYKLSNFSRTKPTTSPNNLQSLLQFLWVASIQTQPMRSYLKQTNRNLLSKHCNFHLKSYTFYWRALFAMQTNQYQIFICHSTATNHCSTFSLS